MIPNAAFGSKVTLYTNDQRNFATFWEYHRFFRPTLVVPSRLQRSFAGRKREQMTRMLNAIWRDDRGQDLIEYALMAGFVAVAAGAIMPGVSTSISTIFSKLASVMDSAD